MSTLLFLQVAKGRRYGVMGKKEEVTKARYEEPWIVAVFVLVFVVVGIQASISLLLLPFYFLSLLFQYTVLFGGRF